MIFTSLDLVRLFESGNILFVMDTTSLEARPGVLVIPLVNIVRLPRSPHASSSNFSDRVVHVRLYVALVTLNGLTVRRYMLDVVDRSDHLWRSFVRRHFHLLVFSYCASARNADLLSGACLISLRMCLQHHRIVLNFPMDSC
jgi:hypothetical protein